MEFGLGINSKWIDTASNFIADDISRLKTDAALADPAKIFDFDYSSLQKKYPELRDCRLYQPSPELLSLLWSAALDKKSPTVDQIKTLKRSGLGRLII